MKQYRPGWGWTRGKERVRHGRRMDPEVAGLAKKRLERIRMRDQCADAFPSSALAARRNDLGFSISPPSLLYHLCGLHHSRGRTMTLFSGSETSTTGSTQLSRRRRFFVMHRPEVSNSYPRMTSLDPRERLATPLWDSRKFRAPAWCDRVLFWTSAMSFHISDEKGLGAGEVVQLGYRRSETPSTSDHKPVPASFRFGCKKIDVERYAEIVREIIDDVSKGPGDDSPQIDIDEGSETIDFGDIRYNVPKSRTVVVKNSGGAAACFTAIFSERDNPCRRQHPIATGPREPRDDSWEAFAGKEVLSRSSPLLVPDQISVEGDSHRQLSLCEDGILQEHPWCSVFPDRGILLPGESLKITFRLLIEDSAARALASGKMSTKLRDTLVLRMDQGDDSPRSCFSLTASYIPSVYGSSLETMVGKAADDAVGGGDRGHLRICPKESVAPQWADVNDIAPTEAAASVPRQIVRIVEFIFQDERRCQQPRLFIEEGVDEEVWSIRKALDSNTEFSPHCAHSTIEALVTLLVSSSPAVIPERACPYGSEASDSKLVEVDTRAFLLAPPPVNRGVFIYLIRFFQSLLAHSSKNGLTVDRLVFVQRFCLLPDARRPSFASGDPQGVHKEFMTLVASEGRHLMICILATAVVVAEALGITRKARIGWVRCYAIC